MDTDTDPETPRFGIGSVRYRYQDGIGIRPCILIPRRKASMHVLTLLGYPCWWDSGFVAWQTVLKAGGKKVEKYETVCLEKEHVFVPFAFDTFGALAPQAIKLLDRVKKVMQSNSPAAKGQCFIFNRVGFAIQKGVAAQLVARLPTYYL